MTSNTHKIAVNAAEGVAVNSAVWLVWLAALVLWARRCERHRIGA